MEPVVPSLRGAAGLSGKKPAAGELGVVTGGRTRSTANDAACPIEATATGTWEGKDP
jgi:hypothetical protein